MIAWKVLRCDIMNLKATTHETPLCHPVSPNIVHQVSFCCIADAFNIFIIDDAVKSVDLHLGFAISLSG
jgi:hypothetical protein